MASAGSAAEVDESVKKLRAVLRTQSINQQAETFLHAFAREFEGRFQEIYGLAKEFAAFCKAGEKDLGLVDAHLFLLSRKEGKTAAELLSDLKVIDYDHNNRVGYIEYLLITYKRLPEQLFRPKPLEASKVDLSKFDSAIALRNKSLEQTQSKARRIAELEQIILRGGPDAIKANFEKQQLELQNSAEAVKDEVEAIRLRMQAAAQLTKIPSPILKERRMFQVEAERAEAERLRLEEEERTERAKSKQRLEQRKALWQ